MCTSSLLSVLLLAAEWQSFSLIDATPATGSPWPMPSVYSSSNIAQPISDVNFKFQTIGSHSCEILESAYSRYHRLIFGGPRVYDRTLLRTYVNSRNLDKQYNSSTSGLSLLQVSLAQECEMWPSLNMDESYTLSVSTGLAVLKANAIWGILHGLETFSQLVYYNSATFYLAINNTEISDAPRFQWRGLLLDTSRHFLSKENILWNLDAMAYNKFNVFHWHIVDDQSFPYQSKKFPALSDQGAYNRYSHVYTQNDIAEILHYARDRGIRVVPEFDTPAHTRSWGKGQQGLLTPCDDGTGDFGPINPVVNSTYSFLSDLVQELVEVFPDEYLHLGGDEVNYNCWQNNPDITVFMNQQQYGTSYDDYRKLHNYYMQKLSHIVSSAGSKYVVWQDTFDNDVNVWMTGEMNELSKITAAGLRAILSRPWYLGESDWRNYYSYEPLSFTGTEKQHALVIGGEACLWGELIDNTNVETHLWPRACAVAERLWSPADVTDIVAAAPRLEEHRCRLLYRGIMAEPVDGGPDGGPGFCTYEARRNG